MKKQYIKPNMVIVLLRTSQTLLVGSGTRFKLGDSAPESSDDYDDGELR